VAVQASSEGSSALRGGGGGGCGVLAVFYATDHSNTDGARSNSVAPAYEGIHAGMLA